MRCSCILADYSGWRRPRIVVSNWLTSLDTSRMNPGSDGDRREASPSAPFPMKKYLPYRRHSDHIRAAIAQILARHRLQVFRYTERNRCEKVVAAAHSHLARTKTRVVLNELSLYILW